MPDTYVPLLAEDDDDTDVPLLSDTDVPLLPEDDNTDVPLLAEDDNDTDVPLLPEDVTPLENASVPLLSDDDNGTAPNWRIEVQKRGRFWQWRRGRNESRVCRYGGKFDNLSDERKAEYHERIRIKNKAKRHTPHSRAVTAR